MTLREQLQHDEGFRPTPYPDFVGDADREKVRALWQAFLATGGTVAVGYGRNLSTNPLTMEEAGYLLDRDLQRVEVEVSAAHPWVNELDPARRAAIFNWAYNVGTAGLLKSPKALAALQVGRWDDAADELLDGPWVGQVGDRARRIARQLATGAWQ